MPQQSIYRIREEALESGRAVYSVQQLANLTGKSKQIATVYMSRLVEKGLAKKIMRGKISFVDNDYVIASQMIEPAYVSLDTALLFHGVITQVTRHVQTVTTVNSITFPGLGIQYHKVPPGLFFGYRRHNMGRSYAFVATPGKAIIDGIYLNHYTEDEAVEYSRDVDFDELMEQLQNFKGYGSKKLKGVILSLTKVR